MAIRELIILSMALCALSSINYSEARQASIDEFRGYGIETKVLLGGEVVKDIEKPNGDKGPNCMLCKAIMKEMFKFLKNNRTEEGIQNGLDKICDLAFHRNSAKLNECTDMVRAYTRELIQLLADETDPQIICMLIEQCHYRKDEPVESKLAHPDEPKSSTISDYISMVDPDVKLNSMRTCVECKLFVKYLQETFQDQQSRESFKSWLLDNLCQNLGEPEMKKSCISMVNQYSDDFFKAIAEQLDPQNVCADLKACKAKHWIVQLLKESMFSSEPVNPFLSNKSKSYADPVCDQCIEVVTNLDEYLSAHSIDHDVSILIEKVCKKLPTESTQDSCKKIVQEVGRNIEEALHTMENPRQFCQTIYLCQK